MKMIDKVLQLERLDIAIMQRLLSEHGIDPIGFNRYFLIDEIAKIIVSEMPSIQKRGWMRNPPYQEPKIA